MEIRRDQLGLKVGEIAEAGYIGHVVFSYIAGVIPVKVKTKLSQEQWDKFCCYWQVLLEKFRQTILLNFFHFLLPRIWTSYVRTYNFYLSY